MSGLTSKQLFLFGLSNTLSDKYNMGYNNNKIEDLIKFTIRLENKEITENDKQKLLNKSKELHCSISIILKNVDREKCFTEFDNFKILHDKEISRLRNSKKNIASMGI